jgi:hypothetical protein
VKTAWNNACSSIDKIILSYEVVFHRDHKNNLDLKCVAGILPVERDHLYFLALVKNQRCKACALSVFQ